MWLEIDMYSYLSGAGDMVGIKGRRFGEGRGLVLRLEVNMVKN